MGTGRPFWTKTTLTNSLRDPQGAMTVQSGLQCLTTQSGVMERVTTFKLLGITLSSDLSWEAHINWLASIRPQPRP